MATPEEDVNRFDLPKDQWGEGPWQNEPDELDYVEAVTRLPCRLWRNRMGVWCGYVGVFRGHPFFGTDYNECRCPRRPQGRRQYGARRVRGRDKFHARRHKWSCPHSIEALLEVHGGVTYTGPRKEALHSKQAWYIGFDCGHYNDISPGLEALLASLPGRDKPFESFGGTYRTVDYATTECMVLAHQLRKPLP